jgi:hypothetical protein
LQLVAHAYQIQLSRRAGLDEDFVALFLDVVVDVLAQHDDLRAPLGVALVTVLDLGNQVLGAGVLDLGFIEQVFGLGRARSAG